MGTLFVDKLDPQSGTSLEIGSSGDTITIPSGATITNNGTQTGFGGVNTPYFLAKPNAVQTTSTNTEAVVVFGEELLDSDSCFASNTFTPNVAGYYYIFVNFSFNSTADFAGAEVNLFKNGSRITGGTVTNDISDSVSFSYIVQMNGSSDNLQVRTYVGGAYVIHQGQTAFGGYKLLT